MLVGLCLCWVHPVSWRFLTQKSHWSSLPASHLWSLGVEEGLDSCQASYHIFWRSPLYCLGVVQVSLFIEPVFNCIHEIWNNMSDSVKGAEFHRVWAVVCPVAFSHTSVFNGNGTGVIEPWDSTSGCSLPSLLWSMSIKNFSECISVNFRHSVGDKSTRLWSSSRVLTSLLKACGLMELSFLNFIILVTGFVVVYWIWKFTR